MRETLPSTEPTRDIEDLIAEDSMHQAFDIWVQGHTNSYVNALPYNPEMYPHQRIDVTKVEASECPLEVVRDYANAVMGQEVFGKLVDDLKLPPDNLAGVAEGRLRVGQNTLVVTAHTQSVLDTAIAHSAMLCALGKESLAPRNGIVMNKLMSRLAIGDIPVTEILAQAGTVYMGIPDTGSAARVGLAPEIIDRVNWSFGRELAPALSGGTILNWALSSGRAEASGDTILAIPTVDESLAKNVSKRLNYAIPIAMWLSEEPNKSRYKIIHPATVVVNRPDDVHTMMDKLAEEVSMLASDKKVVYQSPKV